MPTIKAIERPAAFLLGSLALLVPALLNGFPLVFADTGGYLARPFERTLALGRSALYGLFLAGGIQTNFWPIVVVQAALTVWLIGIVLREFDWPGPGVLVVVMLVLAALTSLPWYAGQLMPDILAPLAVLAFYCLAFGQKRLRSHETVLLLAVIAIAMACHMSIVALIGAQLAFLLSLLMLQGRIALPPPRLALPASAAAAGIALALFSNLAIARQFALTPGGSNFLFARLLQDGIVGRFLNDHCPDPALRLCAFRHELPATADDWLWGDSPLHKLGDWQGFEPEAQRIILGSLRDYPFAHLATALRATGEQLMTVAGGEGMHSRDNWHVQLMLQDYAPGTLQSFAASRQQHDGFDFGLINLIQVPLALLATAMLPVTIVLFRRKAPSLSCFAAVALCAMLTNAAVCGIFSNPNARYQSRIVPLAVLAAMLALLDGWRAWRRSAPA